MDKRGAIEKFCVFFVLVAGLILFSSSASAVSCTNFTYSEWSSCNSGVQTRVVVNSTPVNCSGGNSILSKNCSSSSVNLSKVDKAFDCLTTELKSDCSGATTVQQLAFSILASPNVTTACVNQLLKKGKTEGCYGDNNNCGIKETAWAILALDHAGKDVSESSEWLAKQNKSSSDVEWFLQEDSTGDTNCKITYNGADYEFKALENKKLSGNIGGCFSFAQSNYWLRLDENCFDDEFVLRCDKEFFAGWHYKSLGSSILNVLSETSRVAANQEVKLKVSSKCFGSGSGCNYEDSAWAVLALKKQDYDIKPFVPYLISAEDSNLMYFPAALNYLVLEYVPLYGNKIIQQQKSGIYWEAENSVYGQMYDTALALLAVGNQNQEQVVAAKNWVWNFKQEASGCWNSRNIRDTAFLLWAIEQRRASGDIIITPTTTCAEGNGFCSGQLACTSVGGEILTNYACASFSQYCCNKNPIQSCSVLLGEVCTGGLVCNGSVQQSLEGSCCMGDCVTAPVTSECEDLRYSCRGSCLASEEIADHSCGSSSQVCCSRITEPESNGIPIWVWFLIGILIILIALAVVFRNRIKVWIYKRKKGSQGGSSTQGPPFRPGPPRPGFPPLIRPMGRPMPPMQRRPMPMQRPPIRPGTNTQAQNTFAKLKEMTK